jgi:GntR family transcriptional regulator
MLPFRVEFKHGVPAGRQVVYAVKKAIVSGQLLPGDRFPSVRMLSQELKINPNTAHKAVTVLTREGLLEVQPGIGTTVATARAGTNTQRSALVRDDVESLVVEAKRLGLDLEDVLKAVRRHWNRIVNEKVNKVP